jgi:CRP-like cAMP-binding protein
VKLDSSAFIAAPELIQALEKSAYPVVCGGDRLLFKQGDTPVGLYILNAGAATLTMAAPGGGQITEIQAPAGSLLGLPGLLGNQPYTLSATAHAGARLGFVPRDELTKLMQADPQLSLKMLQVLAAEVSSARRALCEL